MSDPLVLRKPQRCPSCGGGKILPFLYGWPSEEAMARARRGEAILGGCVLSHFQPDWACAGCNHRWFDATDPARQAFERFLEQGLAEPPPVPRLVGRPDGLLERIWRVELTGELRRESDELSAALAARALTLYRQDEAFDPRMAAGARLVVHATTRRPRSVTVTVARGGLAPSKDTLGDRCAMTALEELESAIHTIEGAQRSWFDPWPRSAPQRCR